MLLEKFKRKKWITGRRKNILKTTLRGNETMNRRIKSQRKLRTKRKFRWKLLKKIFRVVIFHRSDNKELIRLKSKMLNLNEKRSKSILMNNRLQNFKHLRAILVLERKRRRKKSLKRFNKKTKF